MTNLESTKSTKKKKNSFSPMDIGTPQVPLRKTQAKKQQQELLSDWEHAS